MLEAPLGGRLGKKRQPWGPEQRPPGAGGEGRNRGPGHMLLGEEKQREVPGTGPPALSSTYLASL